MPKSLNPVLVCSAPAHLLHTSCPPKQTMASTVQILSDVKSGVIHQRMGSSSKFYVTQLMKDIPWQWNSVNSSLSACYLLRQLYSTLHSASWWSQSYCLTSQVNFTGSPVARTLGVCKDPYKVWVVEPQ